MIDINEVICLLKDNNAKNLICKQFEFKPMQIARLIATIANAEYEYGYIILGAEKNYQSYKVIGLSKDFKIDGVLNKSLEYLDGAPNFESCQGTIDNGNVFIIKVYKNEKNTIVDIKSQISEKIDAFLQSLLLSCIKLQSLDIYKDASEDECNDFIAALLESRGFRIKDQTRRGTSGSGKASGELDIFVENNLGMPFTIIEAMNLDSLKTRYIDEHFEKIYKYDTLGNQFNVCLSYVRVNDFSSFWTKYCDYAETYPYKYKLISCDKNADKSFPYTEIRFIKTTHERSGKNTYLYHIAVNI